MNSETRKSMIASTLGIRLAFMVKSSPLLENGANNLLYRLPPPTDAGISPRRDPIDRVRLIAGLAHHGAEADAVNRVPTRGAIAPHHQLMCITWLLRCPGSLQGIACLVMIEKNRGLDRSSFRPIQLDAVLPHQGL